MTNFDRAFSYIIQDGVEGSEYTNDPDDAGGPTKFGITLPDVFLWRGRQISEDDVKNLTENEAKEIYKSFYWDKMSLDKIDDYPIALCLFDQGVNRGIIRAVRNAQIIISAVPDGIMGKNTIQKLNDSDVKDFCLRYTQNAILNYVRIVKEIPSQTKFLEGWINRIHTLQQQVLI